MTAIPKPLAPAASPSNLRAFDVRRDLKAVADLIELCFSDSLDSDGQYYVQRMRQASNNAAWLGWAARATEIGSVPLAGYVWYEGERLVGNATTIPYYIKGRRLYLIANVAVHPDYRRRGIARALTERGIQHARERHCPSVWLHVREENAGAVHLYQGLNFQERARRTSWYSQPDGTPAAVPLGVKLISPGGRHWELQRAWLLRGYPPELSWHTSFSLNLLRPDLWGAIYRSFSAIDIRQWALVSGDHLHATLSWQATFAHTNLLWLAAPPDTDERLIHSLLWQARQRQPTSRSTMLELPARQFETAVRLAGFESHQTLIWMELKLE